MTAIADRGSNSKTKEFFKASDNNSVKMSREKLEYNNTVDDDLLDKESSAKYKTSNRGLNNVNNKTIQMIAT